MSRLTLLHRDLSRRIESLKQIVAASQSATAPDRHRQRCGAGDMHSIDLSPNTSQLIIRRIATTTPNPTTVQRGDSLDEGFESDVDTISLVSTESAMSLSLVTQRHKERETDSANGSASSDSDDPDVKTKQDGASGREVAKETQEEIITEHFNLVNCVCYTDSAHPSVLILVVSSPEREEETLIFKFANARELDAFHENFSTVKAVAAQAQHTAAHAHCTPFNLLQRTDADGMTHIRISRHEEEEQEFTSLLSLPAMPPDVPEQTPRRFEKFATLGKPPRRRMLKKSKSIEDLLDAEKPLRKVWNSAENLLQDDLKVKPKAPPRKAHRKKGPAPLPPPPNHTTTIQGHINLSRSFTSLHHLDDAIEPQSLGNVFQGQFVRVQVDHSRHFLPKAPPPPQVLKYESLDAWSKHNAKAQTQRVKSFDAFKFSDPKNLTGFRPKITMPEEKPRGFAALKLYIPMYKSLSTLSAKKQPQPPPQCQGHAPHATGNFTNRLFGMSSKLKEFGSLQSGCNPNRRYAERTAHNTYNHHYKIQNAGHVNPYAQPTQPTTGNTVFGRLGRLGRSGSLGNLTLLSQGDKSQSNTLKSVIKKRSKDEDEGKRFGRHGKKVTFSAYNTVQVV